ncbi:hypothetical protein [Clostridium sp. LIBA-8841]|uniref:hypothetical protein n=1 Tax=Clostridium sp. LIBA-8841 TaxID=2987530 RepID=UPI002AC4521F|nr:hypothetical protein [Clostridium sp. LIBA-8841]MDZ5254479.1 hypothetical protein [Clostridium sp. LIBA-8841]
MKKVSTILLLMLLPINFLFQGCNISNEEIIKPPNKIVVYYDGAPIEVSKDDKIFKEIVDLTNRRIDKDEISTVKDIVSENYVDSLKTKKLSLEFLYDDEQEMNLTGDGFMPMKYTKLFFLLVSSENLDISNYFQYGTSKNGYTNSSRGPLKESIELIELIMNQVVNK